MLAVLNKHKTLLIILSFILLASLIWLFIAGQGRDKDPTRGVFVLNNINQEEAIIVAASNDKG